MRRAPGAPLLALACALLLAAAPVAAATEAEGAVTATVTISGVVVSLELGSAVIAVGQSVKAEATVTNLGNQAVRSVVVELRFDESGLGVRGGTTKGISNLRAGASGSVSWNVCGRSAGVYVLLATATVGAISIDSEGPVLTVTPSSRRPC